MTMDLHMNNIVKLMTGLQKVDLTDKFLAVSKDAMVFKDLTDIQLKKMYTVLEKFFDGISSECDYTGMDYYRYCLGIVAMKRGIILDECIQMDLEDEELVASLEENELLSKREFSCFKQLAKAIDFQVTE